MIHAVWHWLLYSPTGPAASNLTWAIVPGLLLAYLARRHIIHPLAELHFIVHHGTPHPRAVARMQAQSRKDPHDHAA